MGTDKIACSPIKIVLFCVYLLDYGSRRNRETHPFADELALIVLAKVGNKCIEYARARYCVTHRQSSRPFGLTALLFFSICFSCSFMEHGFMHLLSSKVVIRLLNGITVPLSMWQSLAMLYSCARTSLVLFARSRLAMAFFALAGLSASASYSGLYAR